MHRQFTIALHAGIHEMQNTQVLIYSVTYTLLERTGIEELCLI